MQPLGAAGPVRPLLGSSRAHISLLAERTLGTQVVLRFVPCARCIPLIPNQHLGSETGIVGDRLDDVFPPAVLRKRRTAVSIQPEFGPAVTTRVPGRMRGL